MSREKRKEPPLDMQSVAFGYGLGILFMALLEVL